MSVRAAPPTTICSTCKVAGLEQLRDGQACVTCRSQQAWSDLGTAGLTIDRATLDAAALRRRGEAAGAPRWRTCVDHAPPLVTLAIAAVTAWSIRALMAARPIGPLAALLADLREASQRATLLGLLALVVGAVALVRLRRRREYRKLPFIVSHALAVAVGGSAVVVGGLHWYAMSGGHFGQYTTMPPRASLGLTANVERILNATVVVLAPDASGDARGLAIGTGAVVAADEDRAWIVTCSHVAMPYAAVGAFRHARDAQPVWIQLADGREGRARVRWAAPPPLDVVLIELPIARPPEPVPISVDASLMQPGATATFVPNPYRSGWKVMHGELLRRERHRTSAGTYDLLFTTLPVTFGDSGSGLFDARGQLVGLNTWTRGSPDGGSEGISLPSETMRTLVDAIAGGRLDQLDDTIAPAEKE